MKINIKGIPTNAGALELGTECSPSVLRQAGLIEHLSLSHDVTDFGDVLIRENLIRHNIPPIRNWPSPRQVWEATEVQMENFFDTDAFSIVIGGGCSVLTGVFHSFHKVYGDQSKLISIDHHIDIRRPDSNICAGSTAYTLWFLTHDNAWYNRPEGFSKQSIIALAYDEVSLDPAFYNAEGIIGIPKNEILLKGVKETASICLNSFDSNSKILVHLDLDVIREEDLASVYMPSPYGMPLTHIQELLIEILKDTRIQGIVVTEFSGKSKTVEDDAVKVVALIENSLRYKF